MIAETEVEGGLKMMALVLTMFIASIVSYVMAGYGVPLAVAALVGFCISCPVRITFGKKS